MNYDKHATDEPAQDLDAQARSLGIDRRGRYDPCGCGEPGCPFPTIEEALEQARGRA